MKEIIEKIGNLFPLKDIIYQREDLAFITVDKQKLPSLVTHLRDFENFTHLVLMTTVDFLEKNIFQLTYILHNYEKNNDLGIRVEIDRENPEMISIHHLWEQAATYQQEIHEMFGINFPGSPGVEDDFILEGWQEIPPMRRDFDTLKYSAKTYFPREGRETHDPKEYMKKQLYPKE